MSAVFVSYRRKDEPFFVRTLADRLPAAMPQHQVFIDVDAVAGGENFRTAIEGALDASTVVLAVVGSRWNAGRLDSPDDWVRIELEMALDKGKRVIPVLVGDTPMPTSQDLPASLQPLVEHHALRVTYERFPSDIQGLIRQVREAVAEEAAKLPPAPTPPQGPFDPAQVSKMEALKHWEFVERLNDEAECRHHLALFPDAVTSRMAQRRLQEVIWDRIRRSTVAADFSAFLEEFPSGPHARAARDRMARLSAPSVGRWGAALAAMLALTGAGVGGWLWTMCGDGPTTYAPPVAQTDEDTDIAEPVPEPPKPAPEPDSKPEPGPNTKPKPETQPTPTAPPTCGNGREDPDEVCDFGTADNDGKPGGCTPDCQLVWGQVRPDTYTIGAGDDEEGDSDEGSHRQVRVNANYWVLATEVTEAQQRRWGQRSEGDDRPWVEVKWDDARGWCEQIGGRLPTEAEWEVAARGGSDTPWSCGGEQSCLKKASWYLGNHQAGGVHPVGEKRRNRFHLYDMHGNASEWVQDCYDKVAWRSATNLTANTKEPCKDRVVRGGSFHHEPRDLRTANRKRYKPTSGSPNIGFRCVSDSRP